MSKGISGTNPRRVPTERTGNVTVNLKWRNLWKGLEGYIL